MMIFPEIVNPLVGQQCTQTLKRYKLTTSGCVKMLVILDKMKAKFYVFFGKIMCYLAMLQFFLGNS